MRKPDTFSMFIFISIIRKNMIGDAKLDNNAPLSAPPRALREDNCYKCIVNIRS